MNTTTKSELSQGVNPDASKAATTGSAVRRSLLWTLIGSTLLAAACSSGGAGDTPPSNQTLWDQFSWDQAVWS